MVLLQVVGDGGDGLLRREHTSLDNVNTYIGEDGVQTSGDEALVLNGMDLLDSCGVLSSETGNGCHTVAAMDGDGLEIGFNASSSRGVRAGNGENRGRSSISHDRIESATVRIHKKEGRAAKYIPGFWRWAHNHDSKRLKLTG